MSKDKWIQLLNDQKNSQMSVSEFCRLHNISDKTFYNKRKLLKNGLEEPKLIEVGIQEECSVTENHDIRFKVNGIQFEFDKNIADKDIQRIIRVCLAL